MVAIIFFILLLSVLIAWKGKRKISITLFAIGFCISLFWFSHHITDTIGLSL